MRLFIGVDDFESLRAAIDEPVDFAALRNLLGVKQYDRTMLHAASGDKVDVYRMPDHVGPPLLQDD